MDFFVFISEQWILVSLLVLLIYVFAFTERIKGGKPIGIHEVTRLLNSEEAVLLDVRESKEFSAGVSNFIQLFLPSDRKFIGAFPDGSS